MDTISKNKLLESPTHAIQEIRKLYNLDSPERIKEAVDILEEWLKKQDHILKKDFTRDYLEKSIISCKGSVEKAKKQIDRLCTLKTLLPQFFTKTNLKKELKEISDKAWIAPLPKLTKDFYRIILIKAGSEAFGDSHCLEYIQFNLIFAEYIKAHDYVNGFIFAFDFEETDILNVVKALNPVILQQYVSVLIEGFGTRIKSICVLTQSKLVHLFVNMIKQLLSEKLSNRIHIAKTLDEFHLLLPKELLPADYGGSEKSLKEIVAEWVDELSTEEHVKYVTMMFKAGTDERLRRPDKFNENYMGTPGSFRNMTVD